MKEIYEVVDVSNEEMYFPLGFFPTLEKAVGALDKCAEPRDFKTAHDSEDIVTVEIRCHAVGCWTGSEWEVVLRREFVNKYDEEKDDNVWEVEKR